ncbi:MAG: DUF4390 domain-containing protein [Spirochaetales bacterium]|nr:DUF4390 domain-containing protein [Spirochaetales bacterium]
MPGQVATLSVKDGGGRILATVALSDAPVERVLAALEDGLKSEIVFDLRLFRRQKGFLAWLGDRPLVNVRLSRLAWFDPFTQRYLIKQQDGPQIPFRDEREFLESFLVLAEYPVGRIGPGDPETYYLLSRVRLSPVRIIGPLNIVSLFSSESQITTEWAELELGQPRRSP